MGEDVGVHVGDKVGVGLGGIVGVTCSLGVGKVVGARVGEASGVWEGVALGVDEIRRRVRCTGALNTASTSKSAMSRTIVTYVFVRTGCTTLLFMARHYSMISSQKQVLGIT